MMQHLIGIPYQNKGRNPEQGLDCWGLLREFYREFMGIELPSYDDTYTDAFDRVSTSYAIDAHNNQWYRVTEPAFGDAVLCKLSGHACHVGVYLGNHQMLHTQMGHDSALDRIDGIKWKNRLAGFYRHAAHIGANDV